MTASFSFRPARDFHERHGLFVALVGAPNSGKTFSAMRLARGIAGPKGRIAVLDTEGGRTLHLKGDFDFDFVMMDPPHRPDRYLQTARDAQEAGFDVLVIDSFTNAWRGVGGTLDWIDEELEVAVARAKATADERGWSFNEDTQRFKSKGAAAIRPKVAWKLMIAGFLSLRMPVIFAIRGEQTFDPDTKKEVFKAQVQKNFLFEVTVSFRLSTNQRGAIDLSQPDLYKMEQAHRPMFKDGALISEEHGAALAAWAAGTSEAAPPPPPPTTDKVAAGVSDMLAEITDAPDVAALLAIVDRTLKQRQWLEKNRPDLHATVAEALRERHDRLADAEVPA